MLAAQVWGPGSLSPEPMFRIPDIAWVCYLQAHVDTGGECRCVFRNLWEGHCGGNPENHRDFLLRMVDEKYQNFTR